MTRKNNAPHPLRGRSRYSDRLARRGIGNPGQVRMESVETLRGRQERGKATVTEQAEEADDDGMLDRSPVTIPVSEQLARDLGYEGDWATYDE
jgi:hypothetical protein